MATVKTRSQVVLRPDKLGTFLARHPWVLERSVRPSAEPVADEAVVDLVLPDGRWVAAGIYNAQSRIRVRLYSWNRAESLDDDFWLGRLQRAIQLRQELGLLHPDSAARLVFSEGDGLSGLIVDKYARHLVVQLTARAMESRLPLLLARIVEMVDPVSIQLRVDPKIKQAEGLQLNEQCLHGIPPTEPVRIEHAGLISLVDLSSSQKTGFYLDQRENRQVAARFAAGRSVLDVCCYTGGFALAASRAGATEVLAIDSSRAAIETAGVQAEVNRITNVQFEVADCFERLESLRQSGQRFGLIILDPPKFAGSRRSIDSALRAYHRLNRLAVECLQPSGILVSCSCSGLVTRDDFTHMLAGAAQKCGRDLQILEQRGAAPDHPVMISCPETDYLKCFVCCVAGR